MIRRASIVVTCVLLGCAAPRAGADLEAQVRQLREDQARQAHQLEQLENRVVLAEDSARQARQALAGAGSLARPTVRIGGPEESAPAREASVAPAVSVTGPDPVDDDAADDAQASAASNEVRPVVRLNGHDRVQPAPPGTPIVLRDDDRLPVVPVAEEPPPGAQPPRAPRGTGRVVPSERPSASEPLLPAAPATSPAAVTARADAPGAGSPAGLSSVRDPRALPAYQAALTLARTRRCTEALDAFSAFLVRWPDHPYAENAMYWRGECLLAGGDARAAAGEFEGQLRRFPSGIKAADALYKLVVCYRRLGEPGRAREYADRLLHDFGGSDAAARLRTESDR